MYKLGSYVLWVGPFGVFALMATTVGTYGLSVLKPYAYLIFLVYLTTAVGHLEILKEKGRVRVKEKEEKDYYSLAVC